MENTYLPGTFRDRLIDLLKYHKKTQADLAKQIGVSESTLNRFLSGQTEKLGSDQVIRIARIFNVSTDFLLGLTQVPDRKNYAIDELGLSAQAARNLYLQRVDPRVVTRLLESPHFLTVTRQIAQYLEGSLAAGFMAQNEIFRGVAETLASAGMENGARDIAALRVPVYQQDLTTIQNGFMQAVREMKTDVELETSIRNITREEFDRMRTTLVKDSSAHPNRITPQQFSDAITQTVGASGLLSAETLKKLNNALTSVAEELKHGDDNDLQ